MNAQSAYNFKTNASLESNEQALSKSKIHFSEDFCFKLDTCFQCNGFYAPNFNQPVCIICHMFLHPDDVSEQPAHINFQEKMDDGDSGNEEPKDHTEYVQQRQQVSNSSPMQESPVNPEVASTSSDFQGPNRLPIRELWQLAHTCNTRSLLQEKLNRLTTPRAPDDLKTVDAEVIQSIPPEVWFVIFSFLDDVTLWIVSNVCTRWQQLIDIYIPDSKWKKFTKQRWPLFKSLFTVKNWKNAYTCLTESVPCILCLRQMKFQVAPPSLCENSWRRNRLKNELRTLQTDPPEGIAAEPLDKMALHWQASIIGPAGSPYAGGTFFLYIQIPPSYPLCPPVVRFISRIFHPNVSRHGDIGIDSIQHNWSLALTISKVLISIQSLLTDPYTKVCMEPDIGTLYEEDKAQFERVAKSWTWKHAMHDSLDLYSSDFSNCFKKQNKGVEVTQVAERTQ